MKPLSELPAAAVRRLRGLVFDLDGTVLDDGALAPATYGALVRLAEAYPLVLCTGRSAAWAHALARQWPLALAVAENGAIAFAREGSRVLRLDPLDAEARAQRSERLDSLVRAIRADHAIPLADDNFGRITDRTLDIGEEHQAGPETVAAIRARARREGARTHASSIHLHVTYEVHDKASGVVSLLHERFGDEPSAILSRWAFVGDSGNDASCFNAFRLAVGVANVRGYTHALARTPPFVTAEPGGRGFAALVDRLLELRS